MKTLAKISAIAAIGAATAITLTACMSENPTVLDIQNAITQEKFAEEQVQKTSEESQRLYLDTTESIRDSAGSLAEDAGGYTRERAEDVRRAAQQAAGSIQQSAGEAGDAARQTAQDTANTLKEGAGAAAEGAKNAAGSAVNDTTDALGGLMDGISYQIGDLKRILRTPTSEFTPDGAPDSEEYIVYDTGDGSSKNTGIKDGSTGRAILDAPPFSAYDIPAYTGQACVTINGGRPYFTESDMTTADYELYSAPDRLSRSGTAKMCTSRAMMPKEGREEIGMYKPSGWHQNKYDILKEDGNPAGYLYNRCHLLMHAVGGNDEGKNLITGTRSFNVKAMLPSENRVLEYIANSQNHVIYRVTPIYEGSDLVARGVLMEAASVEDKGLMFCVFAYNVEPGIIIDYATGENSQA